VRTYFPGTQGTDPQGNGATAPAQGQSATGRTGRNPADYSVAECVAMWEAATHMSKQEWRTACQRVQNRLENLHVDGRDPQEAAKQKRPARAAQQDRMNATR